MLVSYLAYFGQKIEFLTFNNIFFIIKTKNIHFIKKSVNRKFVDRIQTNNFAFRLFSYFENFSCTQKIVSLIYGQKKNFCELRKVLLIQKNFL